MAKYENHNKLTIESLKENLFAIDFCLTFDKAKESNWIGESKEGCLGIPAFNLLCTSIDTIGSYFRDAEYIIYIEDESHKIKSASDHFFILNHDKFFKLGLKMATIMDFYSTYRSKIVHNTALPENNFLEIGKKEDDLFQLDQDDKIVKINIRPLFEKIKVAINDFIYYLEFGTFSVDHSLTKELLDKRKEYNPLDVPIITTAATGFTNTKI